MPTIKSYTIIASIVLYCEMVWVKLIGITIYKYCHWNNRFWNNQSCDFSVCIL